MDLPFKKPQRGSKYGKRAEWKLQHAKTTLQAVQTNGPSPWAVPKLDALVQITGNDDDDYDVEEEWTGDLAEWESENQFDDPDRIPDDSAWYSLAEAKMTHHITKQEIKRLKHLYHPSCRVDHKYSWQRPYGKPPKVESGGRRDLGDWISDSETEGATDLTS